MKTRTITVYSTKEGTHEIKTEVKTWKALRKKLSAKYDLSNLQPTESVFKTTLVHDDAVLPEGDFTLFLRPIKVKAGLDFDTLTYKELQGLVTSHMKIYFKLYYITNKNWTHYTKVELTEGIKEYTRKKETGKLNDLVDTNQIKYRVPSSITYEEGKSKNITDKYTDLLKGFND